MQYPLHYLCISIYTALNSIYFILFYIISVLHAVEFCSENAALHIQS